MSLAPHDSANLSALGRLQRGWRALPAWKHAALALLLLVIVIVIYEFITIGHTNFLTARNLVNLLKNNSEMGILAVGMTLVIILGGIDLGVGSLLALAGGLAILVMNRAGGEATTGFTPVLIAIGMALFIGTLAGFFNGMLIAYGRIAPFIATLGGLVAFRSLSRWAADGGQFTARNDWFALLGRGVPIPFTNISQNPARVVPLEISYAFIAFAAVAVIAGVLLSKTRYGRYVIAIGCNETAAKYSAVPVARIKVYTYTLMGTLAGLAALVHATRYESLNSAQAGQLYELDAIAAVVLGGTSMRGGAGGVVGTVIGVLLIGCIKNMRGILGIPDGLQGVIMGAIIIAAVLIQRVGEREHT